MDRTYTFVFDPDPDGGYVRRWVPELQRCETSLIHRPWQTANFESFDYPAPVIEHAKARIRALEAYRSLAAA